MKGWIATVVERALYRELRKAGSVVPLDDGSPAILAADEDRRARQRRMSEWRSRYRSLTRALRAILTPRQFATSEAVRDSSTITDAARKLGTSPKDVRDALEEIARKAPLILCLGEASASVR